MGKNDKSADRGKNRGQQQDKSDENKNIREYNSNNNDR